MVRLALASLLLTLVLAGPAYAQRLPTIVTPEHYDLSFSVDLARARFDGTETIAVRVLEPTASIVLNAAEINFRDVTIGSGSAAQQAVVTLDAARETATFTLARPLARGSTAIHIRYTGTLNDKLRGFYLSHGAGRRYAVTQLESTDARRAFPCFDEPAFKATFSLTLTIDRGDTAISNGRILSDVPAGNGARHTITFSKSPKMSSYLVAMAVGDFACASGAADGIPIRICTTPNKRGLTAIALESAEQILRFYNRYFSIKYPFGKLDLLAVPDFAAGAMENTAAIFFRETDLLADDKTAAVSTRKTIASVIAHEVAHQWFGDLVTMQWWDDIWLNEGFATWMENRPLADMKAEWDTAVDEALASEAALGLDSLQSTRPIHAAVNTPAEIDEAFDVIAYQKGAAVLRMIENYVGRETFRRGVNAYLEAHAYGNARGEDFWNAITAASGKPVDRIMPGFVNQPGFPLLTVTPSCEGTQTRVAASAERFFVDPALQNAPAPERWQVPVCLKASGSPAAPCDVLDGPVQSLTRAGPECARWVFANAGAQGYYRTAYPADMLRALAPRVEADLTAPERLSLAADEWALVRAGRHTAADFLTLASGYGLEPSRGVLGEITGRLAFIRDYLTTDATGPRFEAFVRSLLQPALKELGFSPAAAEPDATRERREVIVQTLGTVGADADVVAQARAALDRALEGSARLDPTLATAIVHVAAEHGDAALFDRLDAASRRSVSPDERDLYFYAATAFRDGALIDRALARGLSGDIRTQDAAIYLSRFFQNPAARARAWSFLKEHWSTLEPKVTIFGGDVTLTSSLAAFCDAGTRDDIRAFFATHPLPGATRMLAQTLERINNCIDLNARQTPVVTDWLARRP